MLDVLPLLSQASHHATKHVPIFRSAKLIEENARILQICLAAACGQPLSVEGDANLDQ